MSSSMFLIIKMREKRKKKTIGKSLSFISSFIFHKNLSLFFILTIKLTTNHIKSCKIIHYLPSLEDDYALHRTYTHTDTHTHIFIKITKIDYYSRFTLKKIKMQMDTAKIKK